MNVAEQAVSTGIYPIDYGDRLRIGVILPSGNTSVEPELTAMAPPVKGVWSVVVRANWRITFALRMATHLTLI